MVALALEERQGLRENGFIKLPEDDDPICAAPPSKEELVKGFFQENCALESKKNTPAGDIYEAFCKSKFAPEEPIDRSYFGKLFLQVSGQKTRRTSTSRYVTGVRLLPQELDSQPHII